jgi:hypothetical protein
LWVDAQIWSLLNHTTMRGDRTTGVLLAALAVLALGVSPALAKKKPSKPGVVRTTAVTVQTTEDHQVVSAVATCPGKTKVVGGGFATGILGEGAIYNGPDKNQVLESRREGPKRWRVTAFRVDTPFQSGGPAGPSLPVTAEAYCKDRPGKISEVAATGVWTGPGGSVTLSPAAACPLGRAVVGGGFSLSQATHLSYGNFITATGPLGAVGWGTTAASTVSESPSATTFAYCRKQAKPPRQTRAGAGMPPADSTVASADTPACPGKLTALGGGFEGPNYNAGQGILLPVESRRVGKSWRASAANLSGGPAGGRLTAFAICG